MKYEEARGFGWASAGERVAVGLAETPYEVLRATAKAPARLPSNLLFGDSIRGSGPQTFRVRVRQSAVSDGAGVDGEEYLVTMLLPDGNGTTKPQRAKDGALDIVFPEGSWNVAGIVVKGAGPEGKPRPVRRTEKGPRPVFTHLAAKQAVAGRALPLRVTVSPAGRVRTVRLHYRALNQLEEFRTLEAPADKAAFTIPGEEIGGGFDLMYYFEALAADGSGWFYPDLAETTPYFVVEVR
jgi:hypothetical protein